MMNPSSDVCKTCAFLAGHLSTEISCGADPYSSVIQFGNIGSDPSILFRFGHV